MSWWARSRRVVRWPALSATCTARSRVWPTPRGVRLFVVGGFSSLRLAAGAPRVVADLSYVRAGFRDERIAVSALVTDDLPATPETLDWVFVSPADKFGSFAPGERLGEYRVGGDVAVRPEEDRKSVV